MKTFSDPPRGAKHRIAASETGSDLVSFPGVKHQVRSVAVTMRRILVRSILTLGILFYGIAVPILEINDTHVFDPLWTPHARLHEVWQLTTNSGIALFSFWLVWWRENITLAGFLGLFVMGGFLFAYAIRGSYDGSMVMSDGSEKTIFGVNLGVAGFGIASALHLLAMFVARDINTIKTQDI